MKRKNRLALSVSVWTTTVPNNGHGYHHVKQCGVRSMHILYQERGDWPIKRRIDYVVLGFVKGIVRVATNHAQERSIMPQ